MFCNSLGTDLRVWDAILPLLSAGLKIIRFDKRGHGLSDCPPAPHTMGSLEIAERLLDMLEVRDALWVGLSIGGLIGQGSMAKRLDMIRAMVLSNTGAKIGTCPVATAHRRHTERRCRKPRRCRDGALVFQSLPRHAQTAPVAQYAGAHPRSRICGLLCRDCGL